MDFGESMLQGQETELSAALEAWYPAHARTLPWRRDRDPYRVWVSEIMLQQTRVEAVIPYYERFMSVLPTVQALAQVPEEILLKLWEGLGYYSRARNLQTAAQQICRDCGSKLPKDYESLRTLAGIGDYTAGAVASIAFGQRVPAVDGNVLRVLSRVAACGADISNGKVKQQFRRAAQRLMDSCQDPAILTQALMELGATVCLPNGAPLCDRCPVKEYCQSCAQGNPMDYPFKGAKKSRKIQQKTVFLLIQQGKVLLHKRPPKGLLAGLWEFPNLEGDIPGDSRAFHEFLEGLGLSAIHTEPLPEAKHIFTHVEWQIHGLLVVAEGSITGEGYVWANSLELSAGYAVPGAFQAYRNLLKGLLS